MRYLVALLLLSDVSFADQLRSHVACAPLLSSKSDNWGEVYLNLLDLALEGIDEIHAFGHGDRMQVKTQLLNGLVLSEAPVSPLDIPLNQNVNNSARPATPRNFSNFSPKLSTLADSGQFEITIDNLAPEDWAIIRKAIAQKIAQQQNIQKEQDTARPTTQNDFLDLPDTKGETRLFQMIRQQRFKEAQQLVESSLMTPHYINHLNKEKLTALDTLNDFFHFTNDYEFRIHLAALKEAMLRQKAKTSEQLTELTKKVVEAAQKNDTPTIQQIYDEGLNLFFDNITTQIFPSNSPVAVRIYPLVTTYIDTPLHAAVRNGHLEATELLIKLGSNVDAFGDLRYTPLLLAMLHRAPIAVIKAILAAQPNLEIPLTSNATVLLWAIKYGRLEAVKLLLEHEARTDAKDNAGNGAFHWLTKNFNAELIPLFIKYGLDINQTNNNKETALHQACQQFEVINDALIPELLKHGADPTLKDSLGLTPYDWTKNIADSKTKETVRAELRRYMPSRRERLRVQAKGILLDLLLKIPPWSLL